MQGQLCTEPIEVIFDPGALVMNLTQIVVENDCIWGQSDYPRSQMNDSFWVKKWLLSGSKQGNDPAQGCKWLYWGVRIRKWPQNVSQWGFKDDHN